MGITPEKLKEELSGMFLITALTPIFAAYQNGKLTP